MPCRLAGRRGYKALQLVLFQVLYPMVASASDEASCPALSYPRMLRGVLSDDDRRYLARIYFERVRPSRSSLTYYNLLRHLGGRREERAWSIIGRIRAKVEAQFGAGFELVNDFYSYRAASSCLFVDWHQDGEFWLTADGHPTLSCTGFNLWIMLDHHRMNYSFDVIDTDRSRPLYAALYNAARVVRRSRPRSANATGVVPFNTQNAVFGSSANQRCKGLLHPAALSRAARRSGVGPRPWINVPLAPGDALVLRQVEIHRTDAHQPESDQWRLALGFKVMRRRAVLRHGDLQSPFGKDTLAIRAQWPGLLPEFSLGRPLPLVYNRTAIDRLDTVKLSTQGLWTLVEAGGRIFCPEVLCTPRGHNPLLFILPTMLILLIYGYCQRPKSERHSRW